MRSLDPTRPVTAAINGLTPDKDPYFATLDIAGYNYAAGGDHGTERLVERDHLSQPRLSRKQLNKSLAGYSALMQAGSEVSRINICAIFEFRTF